MSLGSGYRYLMESVAKGDGAIGSPDSPTRYHAESGTPPGVFLGAGLPGLAGGEGVEKGSTVTEERLPLMVGMCADPVTGAPLGRLPNNATLEPEPREKGLDPPSPADPDGPSRGSEKADGAARPSLPRAGPGTCGGVRSDVLCLEVRVSGMGGGRPGHQGGHLPLPLPGDRLRPRLRRAGGVPLPFWGRRDRPGRRRRSRGGELHAHWDSRAGDPQLQVVVLNRARSTSDGVWRTLDSRGLFKQTVALSELHHCILSDLLTERLGWGWDARRHSNNPRWDVTGVPELIFREFPPRADAIETHTDTLIAEFAAAYGRPPVGPEVLRLRQHSRPPSKPDPTRPPAAWPR